MSGTPGTALGSQQASRYLVTKLDSGDQVIADTRDFGNPLVYMLTLRPIENCPHANWKIQLGSLDVRNHSGGNVNDIGIETLIWEADVYLRKESAARSMVTQILITLERDEIEIRHPYELAFRFGGQITL